MAKQRRFYLFTSGSLPFLVSLDDAELRQPLGDWLKKSAFEATDEPAKSSREPQPAAGQASRKAGPSGHIPKVDTLDPVVQWRLIKDVFNVSRFRTVNAALDAAVSNGGGTVYIPSGVYEFSTTLAIGNGSADFPPIRIVGEGGKVFRRSEPVGSVLLYTARDGSPAISASTASFLDFSGFALAGGLYSELGSGIGATGNRVGNGSGITCESVQLAFLKNLEISGFDKQGIYFTESYESELHTCAAFGNGVGYEGFNDNATTLYNCLLECNGTGAKNPQRCMGTVFESNYGNGISFTLPYHRANLQDCYFENNGFQDDHEYADIWSESSTVLSISGDTTWASAAAARTNRMTHLAGQYLWVAILGSYQNTYYPKKSGAWEFGNLANRTNVVDFTAGSMGFSLMDLAWNNKANTFFSGYSYQAGTATLLSGTTSVSIKHQLPQTPFLFQLQITPSSLGRATRWWISNMNDTSFAISVDTNPGQNISFGWRANGRPA
jgi:hypothetical protein